MAKQGCSGEQTRTRNIRGESASQTKNDHKKSQFNLARKLADAPSKRSGNDRGKDD